VSVFARRWRHMLRTGIIVTIVGFATVPFAAAPAAAASGVGYVRLAHLSPDTPDVDVYLDSLSSSQKQQVFKGVGYGTVSPYLAVPVGTYAVSMRASGASATSKALLTTDVTVTQGSAHTVAGVGRHAALGLKVFTDDLSSPLNGKAKVRIIQASVQQPLLDITLTDGETVASNVAFATTTSYNTVSSGHFTLDVGAPGASGDAVTKLNVRLDPDSVYSLIILDGPNGLAPDLRTDATRAGPVPTGGVPTGLGGTAPDRAPVVLISTLAGLGVLLAGTAIYLFRRRARWPASHAIGR
jgi:uncharacterized protein DUF4397